MNKIQQRVLVGTACAAAALFAGSASADHDTFFFNYGHTFVYSAFDGDAEDGDISANTFDFGIQMNETTRLGLYAESITGDAGSDNIRGFMTEYKLMDGDFASSLGLMLGKDGNAASIADIYGKFSLQTADHSEIFAKIAYRGAPEEIGNIDSGDPDDHNAIYLNLGFGFSF
ncbi:hypothetical protein LRD18_11565 [Halorhodospira halochloris]|uniref:hypothetical protein n=1 Tax=Halorhodospira halochloris TaxID=1052 RepID=UPI001EE91FC3|nr:hypothetical protein [Halorhodospira halochloris]MCG5531483.1 hypothetical protein [Halorhodospira halochloris]